MKKRYDSILESLFVLVCGLYPMRHIFIGLDLWDTGYNYANFQYMGLEHMDSMWLFSTYLSNVVGNFLMKLPAADSLAGMNLYTGLMVSLLALMGYLFCTRRLGISPVVAFVGEFAAMSLCWCPTALLYNYLTYVLFLGCVILLYVGLVNHRNWCLFAAGICLGCNVLVRFSNLPEAAMIVAVWAYGVIEAREDGETLKSMAGRTVKRTLWCMCGYLAALSVLFGDIGIRYGLNRYVEGIQRLFAMTDNATDYKATSMLMGVVNTYRENLYWLIRIGVILLAGMAVWFAADWFRKSFRTVRVSAGWNRLLDTICHVVCVLLAAAMLVWLYDRGFCSWKFYSYDSMLRPAVLFLMLTMLIGVVRVLQRGVPKEEKLISGMVVLVVLLTSIGSNNGVYPSINNLFIAAPYTFWQCSRFVSSGRSGKWFPVKCILAAFLAMFLFQSTFFGAKFVFAEATGVQDTSATVENNEILKGIQMSPDKAQWIRSISAYVTEKDLQGREVILYGQIPALSYYLQMPSAFNPWSDLRSYSVTQMEADMERLMAAIDREEIRRPVIIAEKSYAAAEGDAVAERDTVEGDAVAERDTVEGTAVAERDTVEGTAVAKEAAAEEGDIVATAEPETDVKWQLLLDFMERYGYQQTFTNEKFAVWE